MREKKKTQEQFFLEFLRSIMDLSGKMDAEDYGVENEMKEFLGEYGMEKRPSGWKRVWIRFKPKGKK